MRRILQLLALCLLAGCASLPEVHPWYDGPRHAPTIVGAHGLLNAEQSKAVLARLQRQGKSGDLLARHIAYEEALAGTPLTANNGVKLLFDGPATYKAMFEAIDKARDHINLEFYTFEDDEMGRRVSDALLRQRARGVAVNLIYDSVGSINTPPEFFNRLKEAGVHVLEFNPVNPLLAAHGWRVNNRDHRKIAIVDGTTAFVGGINVSSVYSSRPSGHVAVPSGSRPVQRRDDGWRDTNIQITGPAVQTLQKLYLQTWEQQSKALPPPRAWFPRPRPAGKELVRVIGSEPGDAAIYATYVSAIQHAVSTVHLTMAYFVPDVQTIKALEEAAQRGVEVILILPSYTDFWAVFHAGRSHYEDLLEAGVKIYERQDALLHAKTAVIDGVWSTVGSSNMDWRSYLHNQEVNAIVLGAEFGAQMEDMFARDLKASRRITREDWARRPLQDRLREWAARMWAYWL